MMFLDSPSQLAPAQEWKAYVARLDDLDARDVTVIAEKERAGRILALLEDEAAVPYEAGDKVFVRSEQRLATVLDVYGDGVRGDYGVIRLDLSGNTDLDDVERYDVDKHAAFDHTFIPIPAEWKASYGITKDVPLRD
jgi:hypothetical protein